MSEENYILFDQYLQGELSDAEKETFENKLKRDVVMASEFENFNEVNFQLKQKFSIEKQRLAFRQKISKIAYECRKMDEPKVKSLRPWFYSVAASVAVLLGVWFLMQASNLKFKDFNHYENAYFVERGDVNANLKLAQEAFNAKNYQEATVQFEIILKDKSSPEIQLYYGISLMELDRLKEASVIFETIRSGTSIYKNKASWSLALLQLKQKDYESCEATLKTITEDYEDYDIVQSLIGKLEN
ncbi:tetratricopeptide repeat protein [Flavobacterium sp. 7A]|uniref:tetratricopeptide repeat protein n=1 Tax=Flavobacterium sp. 7A TaxID=2940571 RepID=UPI00222731C1|nr:tetratricopeptide repeat protein [Flavobacterium sp. 7A]MCW2118208.1 tetratricopeptide (TPR) repeat protein [Flavobacterium sp. 7A]